MSRATNALQQSVVIRIRLVDKKVFKKFHLFLNKPVKEARTTIAKEINVDADQYGLFLPPKEEQAGKWCRDDYPLSFYGLEGEKESKEASHLMNNPASVEYLEFKKRFRPVRMIVSTQGTIATRAVTVDDTKQVADALKDITEQVGTAHAISEDELFNMHEDEYEVLSSDMTIREQGFLGECTMGLYKKDGKDVGLYVKVPYAEGWIMRKRGGGVLKGLKNWNKRWYVLKKNKIMYFKSKASTGQEPLGSIPIKNIVHVKQSVASDIPSKYEQLCFEIVTPARTFVMLAFSEHEFCSWMTHLETARRMFANETIFLSPQQSGDSSPNTTPTSSPRAGATSTSPSASLLEQKLKKEIKGENQRRMTLVILSDEEAAIDKRTQMLKRVQTAPAISTQQDQAAIAAHVQAHSQPPTPTQPPAAAPTAAAASPAIVVHAPVSKAEDVDQELRRINGGSPRIGAESPLLGADSPRTDDNSPRMDSPIMTGDGSFVRESSFLRDVINSLPGESSPQNGFASDQLFSDALSIERIGDEWLGPSYANEVDLRYDFSHQAASEKAEFSLVKSSSFLEDLSDTANFSPRIPTSTSFDSSTPEFSTPLSLSSSPSSFIAPIQESTPPSAPTPVATTAPTPAPKEELVKAEPAKPAEPEPLHPPAKPAAPTSPSVPPISLPIPTPQPSQESPLTTPPTPSTPSTPSTPVQQPTTPTPVQTASTSPPTQSNPLVHSGSNSIRSPRPQQFLDEEPVEGDAEFIKENEDLKYLFYEPRAVRVKGEMLRAWAAYLIQKGGHPPIHDWQAAHKQLQMYLQLLHHLDSETVPSSVLQESAPEARANVLQRVLSELGIEGFSAELLLKGEIAAQKDLLLAIYEGVGTESLTELYYDLVSRRNAACRFINSTLKDDPNVVNIVPFHPLSSLKVLSDGSILCFLINKVFPNTIDPQLISAVKRVLHPTGVPRGVLLALNTARALGGDVSQINAHDWTDPHKKVRMLHELIWSVVELCGLKCARPKYNPNLAPLQRRNEDSNAFHELDPVAILVRWVNHFLRKRSLRHINNLSDDLEDGENYVILLEAIASGHISRKQALAEQDWEKRATAILRTAKLLGCRMLITPRDISDAENGRLGPLFVAELLRVRPGFTKQEVEEARQLNASLSNEVRAEVAFNEIQPWLESLDLGVETLDIAETFKDGTVLLKILDAIAPGAVDPKWLKVEPKGSRFKMVELANKTIEIATTLKINTSNIGGVDLVNGEVRPTVALLNQFSRYGNKANTPTTAKKGAAQPAQPAALVWANAQVAAHGKTTKLMSFKDQFLRDGRFLLDLVSSLYPKVVNPASVTAGHTEEEQEHNARYLLSLLWSLGIPVCVLWDDIVNVRAKPIKHLLETLQAHYDEKTKAK